MHPYRDPISPIFAEFLTSTYIFTNPTPLDWWLPQASPQCPYMHMAEQSLQGIKCSPTWAGYGLGFDTCLTLA